MNGGETTISERMFPTDGVYTVAVRTGDAARVQRADIWVLRSIWR